MAQEQKTEFGQGFVYCIMLFAKHFENEMALNIATIAFLLSKTAKEREIIFSDNPPPNLSYDRSVRSMKYWFEMTESVYHGDHEAHLSSEITLWFNGASDHLYKLNVPNRYYGTKIENIATFIKSRALEIGHGFRGGVKYTHKDCTEIIEKTKELCMLIDKDLGADPIKGEWE